jgi:hypothetical protein
MTWITCKNKWSFQVTCVNWFVVMTNVELKSICVHIKLKLSFSKHNIIIIVLSQSSSLIILYHIKCLFICYWNYKSFISIERVILWLERSLRIHCYHIWFTFIITFLKCHNNNVVGNVVNGCMNIDTFHEWKWINEFSFTNFCIM